jgi:hypothetical protein
MAILQLLGSTDSPASASQVTGTAGIHHHAWFVNFYIWCEVLNKVPSPATPIRTSVVFEHNLMKGYPFSIKNCLCIFIKNQLTLYV